MFSRREEFLAPDHRREGMIIELETGATRDGRLVARRGRLVLDKGEASSASPSGGNAVGHGGGAEIEAGLLNERRVNEIAKNQKVVVISEAVVVTPLAYDRARACGLEIVRKRR